MNGRLFGVLAFSFALSVPTFSQFVPSAANPPSAKDLGAAVRKAPERLQSAPQSKADPLVRYAASKISRAQNISFRSLSQTTQSVSEYLDIDRSSDGILFASLFVRSTSVFETASMIDMLGGRVTGFYGDILTVRLPLDKISALEIPTHVVAIQGSRVSRTLMNVSRGEIKADQVHTGVSLPRAYRGTGVVVGVLDSGLDFTHEDFTGSSGTRITYLVDMRSDDTDVEYTKNDIDTNPAGVLERDGNGAGGHGTHVTGTAAGSGKAGAGYEGIAPDADIIFVKGIRNADSDGGFSDADVVGGVSYIFTKAALTSQPAVVNLSLGGHGGPHDGTSLYEQSLSNLVGPGKIIVAAAGNEGSDNIHAGYSTSGTSVNDAKGTFVVVPQTSSMAYIDLWYNTGSISVGIAAYDQSLSLLAATQAVAPGQSLESDTLSANNQQLGIISIDATTTADPNNGAHRVQLAIDNNNGALDLSQVFWYVFTYGTGTFDMWANACSFDTYAQGSTVGGDNTKSVGSPATAIKVISVGSYITKNQWVDIDAVTQMQTSDGTNPVTIGNISAFSSLGPTRDGRTKPDITAPGEAILSALSSHLTIGTGVQRSDILQGGKYQKQQGTSMATPHIAGVVALMLQANPALGYDSVKTILQETARSDAATGSVPNNTFGPGKVDALEAVKRAASSVTSVSTVENSPTSFTLSQNYPNPFNPETVIEFQTALPGPVSLAVYDVLGRRVADVWEGIKPVGTHTLRFNAASLPSGVYVYRLTTPMGALTRTMVVAK